MKSNKNTLLQRYYGMHIMYYNDLKMYFVVMNNVFDTKVKVQYKYDLKGSTYERISRDKNKSNYNDFDFSIPMKDLDFAERKEKIKISKQDSDALIKQVNIDGQFLANHNINDYSFLIGIHEIKGNTKDKIIEHSSKEEVYIAKKLISASRKPFFESYKGGLLSKDRNMIYFFGIIDIFTDYGTKKSMEHFFKSIVQGDGISCMPPDEYYLRFHQYFKTIFKTDDDDVIEVNC